MMFELILCIMGKCFKEGFWGGGGAPAHPSLSLSTETPVLQGLKDETYRGQNAETNLFSTSDIFYIFIF